MKSVQDKYAFVLKIMTRLTELGMGKPHPNE